VIQALIEYFKMSRDSRWLERHPTIQARFEQIEDWLEDMEEALYDIEQRVEKLEEMAHPKCGIESFDGYEPLVKRIDKLEVVVGVLKKNDN
jgi:hypothetical protein